MLHFKIDNEDVADDDDDDDDDDAKLLERGRDRERSQKRTKREREKSEGDKTLIKEKIPGKTWRRKVHRRL